MALKIFDGSTWDTLLVGTETISTANTNLTTTYQAGADQTAPNTTNKITGVLFYIAVLPSAGDFQVEVRESGVSKVSGTALFADLNYGWNYIRFTTPYQFTTTAANAYTPYIKNTTTNNGAVARSNTVTKPLLIMTYDTATTLGATDDAFICGFHDSGLTTKTLNLTGTSNSWGDGADKNTSSTTARSLGMATNIGTGGTLKFDTTANCKLTQLGSILVTGTGVFDMRPGSSYVNTLEFNNDTADGNYGLITAAGSLGGQILTTGKTVSVKAQYASGTGTAANPLITQSAHGFAVNDEIVIPGLTYSTNQVKFVKTIPSATQLTLSDTAGGAESAITNTPAVGVYIANMTRNSIIKNTTTTRGFTVFNNSTASYVCDFSYTRMEYPNCLSSKGLILSSTGHAANIDGLVVYNNSAAGRTTISWGGTITQTSTDIVLYNTRGTNFSAQSGLVFSGQNKTVTGLYHYANPGSTTTCAAASFSSSSTANTLDNCHSYGANASNGGAGYAIGNYGVKNTITNSTVDSSRVCAVRLNNNQLDTFTSCNFGLVGTNTTDIACDTTTLIRTAFDQCYFGSATLISGYTSINEGSDITFFEMDGNTSKHRWYNNHGSFWSSGTGLTDTTVRTASSLALAIKPEDATTGAFWEFLVPAVPSSQCGIFGYAYRNATFSSGTFKVELFLPGSTSADASYTFATTTGSWLPFNISAYYSGSVSRYATVRITAITATAGAYAFIDDLYDAGTGNKVAGLDVWYKGKPSTIMVATDTSAIPAQVWGYSDQTTSANTMGQQLVDVPSAAQNATAVESALSDDFAALPTASENADAVWDEAQSGHTTAGTYGKVLSDTESNSDVTQAKVDQLT